MAYLYETHLHTSVGSKCSTQTPEEQLRRFQYYGYTGVFITDHFLNGNTTVDRSLPWEDAINAYCRAYEEACEVGARIGIDVFFGFESSYAGNDVLTYGLGKDWLFAHPEIMDLSMRAYCEFARSEGGLVVHAHPFREAGYIDLIRLMPRSVDAVEVLNACRTDFENDRAVEYAHNYGLAVTAGSDIHRAQKRLCAVSSPVRFACEEDYCNAVRNGTLSIVTPYDGRPDRECR